MGLRLAGDSFLDIQEPEWLGIAFHTSNLEISVGNDSQIRACASKVGFGHWVWGDSSPTSQTFAGNIPIGYRLLTFFLDT